MITLAQNLWPFELKKERQVPKSHGKEDGYEIWTTTKNGILSTIYFRCDQGGWHIGKNLRESQKSTRRFLLESRYKVQLKNLPHSQDRGSSQCLPSRIALDLRVYERCVFPILSLSKWQLQWHISLPCSTTEHFLFQFIGCQTKKRP